MGLQMKYHLKLHERYGPLVRIGPKHISFSDSSLIPQIYGITSKFWKVVNLPPGLREQTKLMIFQSDFYKMFDIKAPGGQVPTVFSV
ncbi:hypothetical protein LTS16_001639 [Friedmanniomyces endolithicus]|nr:hypothetical protein LTR35_015852 [Friedmanniomyces endolithicus]KAK0275784.1 hypothetical protein LTS00_014931 [Friedmanniomyces endolithicus]KAK0327800.1 hypothetical protein LTR82_001317 [Friedmanniomyces endolithicus]KAK0918618.1 hypothetical protein LTR57_011572 [Friedmanniomyces endolithicus]KAK0979736.1 hypothetical protein LTR54_015504 [Friedmanniomyces endolithicus]